MTTHDLAPERPRPRADQTAPYAPSWVNRLTTAVAALPCPAWLAYLLFALVWVLVYAAIKWRDGAYPVGTFFPFHVVISVTSVYYLALIHYLDRAAHRALARFRPALDPGAADVTGLAYRLTTLPARRVWLVSLAGLLCGMLVMIGVTQGILLESAARLFTSPLARWFEIVTGTLGVLMLVIFIYHTYHQLRLIDRIYTTSTQIDLFALVPLHAFSNLTAHTAIGWLLLNLGWALATPDVTTDLVVLGTAIGITLLGLATFLWPLLGIHQLLVEEKTRAKDATGARLKTTLDELHRGIDACQPTAIATSVQAVTGLKQEWEWLDKIPTWPWHPDTLRIVLTALLLPILLWLITRLLERLFS